MNALREDGHLHDLALEDVLDGEPGPGAEEHLAACALCRARVQAAEGVPAVAAPTPEPANRPHGSWAVGALVAAAAAVALVAIGVGSDPVDDGIRVRGSGVQLRVYRDEGDRSRRLRDGAEIRAGDRVGFAVEHREGGHLMVLGIDARSEAYVCYPQGGGGQSIIVGPSPTSTALPEAIEMDDAPGTEHLFALLCEAPFALDDVVDELRGDRVPEGCSASDVMLVKP